MALDDLNHYSHDPVISIACEAHPLGGLADLLNYIKGIFYNKTIRYAAG